MSKLSEEEAIQKVDQLYVDDAIEEAYELIFQYEDSTNPSVVWRLARMSRYMAQKAKDPETKTKFTYAIRDHAKRGIDLDDNSAACHKVNN